MISKTVGFALTGSFCTFEPVLAAMKALSLQYETVVPILSFAAGSTDSRFGAAASVLRSLRSGQRRAEADLARRGYEPDPRGCGRRPAGRTASADSAATVNQNGENCAY